MLNALAQASAIAVLNVMLQAVPTAVLEAVLLNAMVEAVPIAVLEAVLNAIAILVLNAMRSAGGSFNRSAQCSG